MRGVFLLALALLVASVAFVPAARAASSRRSAPAGQRTSLNTAWHVFTSATGSQAGSWSSCGS